MNNFIPQRILSQSVNSVAVLRMFGRGGPPGIRGARGGGPDRGRGRGKFCDKSRKQSFCKIFDIVS